MKNKIVLDFTLYYGSNKFNEVLYPFSPRKELRESFCSIGLCLWSVCLLFIRGYKEFMYKFSLKFVVIVQVKFLYIFSIVQYFFTPNETHIFLPNFEPLVSYVNWYKCIISFIDSTVESLMSFYSTLFISI